MTALDLRRDGVGFYTLRHTFRTLADSCTDLNAIMRIMGHTFPGMAATYVSSLSDDRLKVVSDHVRYQALRN